MKPKPKPKGKKMVAISATAHNALKAVCRERGTTMGATVEKMIQEAEKCQSN